MSARIRVKICGLRRFEDADLAVTLGADAVGFVFWPRSPRAVTVAEARAITHALPPFITRVGVFVDASPDEVAVVVERAGLDAVQLHGGERLEAYGAVRARLLKVAGLESDAATDAVLAWPRDVMPLVDAIDHERKGGTGQVADWSRAARVARGRRIVLAGGLTSENVAEAVRTVRPWGVDVSSGVESAPGVKSAERLRAFFAAVRAVELEGK
jgi:phosphoribosylanthranilate isomerase